MFGYWESVMKGYSINTGNLDSNSWVNFKQYLLVLLEGDQVYMLGKRSLCEL